MNITQLAAGSVVFSIFVIIFTIIVSIYSLYLNWKQSKVKNQMETLIQRIDILLNINTQIFKELKKLNGDEIKD